jgi:hypothetical protein
LKAAYRQVAAAALRTRNFEALRNQARDSARLEAKPTTTGLFSAARDFTARLIRVRKPN